MKNKKIDSPQGNIQKFSEKSSFLDNTLFRIPIVKKLYDKYWVSGPMDLSFFIIVIALLTIGLIMLFSSSYPYAYQKYGNSYYFFNSQFKIAIVGVIGMMIVSHLDIKLIKKLKWVIVPLSVILLIVVLFYHTDLDREEDFKRWIPLFGNKTFQPSDLAKFAIVVLLAWYMEKFRRKMKSPVYGVLIPFVMIGVFAGLIYLENHLSCTVLIFMMGVAMMYCGGTKKIWYVIGIAFVAAIAIVVIKNPDVLPGYQGNRIKAWLDKGFDPLGLRWQTNNSLYAIGSGGLFGVGLGNSKQKYLYVSEPQNDFIFSIICEELGFVGATAIMILFILLFIRGVKIASKCNTKFSALVVTGIVLQVAIQTAFNILVVTDTFPNTGIALPFFSFGGTALGILLLEMGVVLSASRSNNMIKEEI